MLTSSDPFLRCLALPLFDWPETVCDVASPSWITVQSSLTKIEFAFDCECWSSQQLFLLPSPLCVLFLSGFPALSSWRSRVFFETSEIHVCSNMPLSPHPHNVYITQH